MRTLGMIAAMSTLLAACGESSDGPPAAEPANQSDVPAAQSETPVDQNGASANPVDPSGNQEMPASQGDASPAEPTAAKAESGGKGADQPAAAAACRSQDGKPLSVSAVRAVGTEPFWGAQVDGRCVTYSHPEDPKGTRVWTRFTAAPGGGTWSGSLNGKRFELRIRPERGCSDGMSDKIYPLGAVLVVGGEKRSGCAEPL